MTLSTIARVQVELGDKSEAATSLKESIEHRRMLSSLSASMQFEVATNYGLLAKLARDSGAGLKEEEGGEFINLAIAELRSAIADGYDDLKEIDSNEDFQSLRGNEEFEQLLVSQIEE